MIIDAALREAAYGSGPLALVTVAKVSGSAPRHAGSRMALRSDGGSVGTVGGGRPEASALEEARACLERGRNGSISVEMTGAEATGPDLICGGVADIWIERVVDRSLYAAAAAAVDSGETVVIVSSARDGCLAVLGPDGHQIAAVGTGGRVVAGSPGGYDMTALAAARASGLSQVGDGGLLYSLVEPADRLLILGGGHVGQAIARAAASLSFRITVADPRPEFSDSSRFPSGVECLCSGFAQAIEGYRFGPSTYAVVVSPGHLGDLECMRAIVRKEYRYAGFIGSKRKSRMLIEELVAEGAPREKAEALRAPIGLDIGAETPEEIAVAILAEIVAVRRNAPSMADMDARRIKLRNK